MLRSDIQEICINTSEKIGVLSRLKNLNNWRLQDIAIMMYKVKHTLLPSYVVDIFEENETRYQLCKQNDFKIPRFQSARYGKHSLRFQGPC